MQLKQVLKAVFQVTLSLDAFIWLFSPSVENFTSINYIFHSKKLMMCFVQKVLSEYVFFKASSECYINSLSLDTNFAIGHVCCSFNIR